MVTNGRVVLLNGVSSSGKSTFAALLQQQFAHPWTVLALDALLAGAPPPQAVPPSAGEIESLGRLVEGAQAALRAATSALVEHGVDVIVDTVLQGGERDAQAWRAALDERLLLIGVHAGTETIVRREGQRTDRPSGLAAAQLHVHRDVNYDLLIRTDDAASVETGIRHLQDLLHQRSEREIL